MFIVYVWKTSDRVINGEYNTLKDAQNVARHWEEKGFHVTVVAPADYTM